MGTSYIINIMFDCAPHRYDYYFRLELVRNIATAFNNLRSLHINNSLNCITGLRFSKLLIYVDANLKSSSRVHHDDVDYLCKTSDDGFYPLQCHKQYIFVAEQVLFGFLVSSSLYG